MIEPVVVNTKVRWIDLQPVGTRVSLLAPSQGARSFNCYIASISGEDNTDVGIGFDFLNVNPFPAGTYFELSLIEATGAPHGKASSHRVIAEGETL